MDINPFLDALAGRELIFHAADYDLRLLRKHHEFTPSVIFDTMLAARLLGERQFGLGALVEKFLGVKLDKGPQKADWAQRPLTQRMENYARNDTHIPQAAGGKIAAPNSSPKAGSRGTRKAARGSSWNAPGRRSLIPMTSGASRAARFWNAARSPSCANSGTGANARPSPPAARRFSCSSHETMVEIAAAVAEQQAG